jgi:hypothetical protein
MEKRLPQFHGQSLISQHTVAQLPNFQIIKLPNFQITRSSNSLSQIQSNLDK